MPPGASRRGHWENKRTLLLARRELSTSQFHSAQVSSRVRAHPCKISLVRSHRPAPHASDPPSQRPSTAIATPNIGQAAKEGLSLQGKLRRSCPRRGDGQQIGWAPVYVCCVSSKDKKTCPRLANTLELGHRVDTGNGCRKRECAAIRLWQPFHSTWQGNCAETAEGVKRISYPCIHHGCICSCSGDVVDCRGCSSAPRQKGRAHRQR